MLHMLGWIRGWGNGGECRHIYLLRGQNDRTTEVVTRSFLNLLLQIDAQPLSFCLFSFYPT